MFDSSITVFLRKEWRDLRGSPQVLPGYLILPLLAVVVPTVMIAVFPLDPATAPDPDIATMLRFAARDPLLAAFPERERLVRLVIREAGLFFLLMPVMLSGMGAALAIAGEKQQRTLEPVLATPLSDRDFLLAKLLAVLVPSVLVTWLAAVLYAIAIAVVTAFRFDAAFAPTGSFLVVVIAVVPLAGAAAALMGMRASIRAADVQSAVQTASLWVIPIGLVVIVTVGRIAVRSLLAATLSAAVMAAITWWIFRGTLKRFEREEILTRWG